MDVAAGGSSEEEKYVDKILITYAKNPSFLRKYFKDRPAELDEALRHMGLSLTNTKQVDDLVVAELHVEERSKSHDPVDFRCSPKWTVYSAKLKIAEQFPFAVDCMYVIYKRQIASDWMYLRECGVQQNKDVLYVYIHIPQSVKPRIVANPVAGAKPQTLKLHQQEPLIRDRQLSVTSPMQTLNILPMDFENVKDPLNFDLDAALAMPQDFNSENLGKLWVCKECTFMNEGWRTECCMCNTAKPAEEALSLTFNAAEETVPFATFNNATVPENLENAAGKLQPQPQAVNEWKCAKCTFVNDASNANCRMCTSEGPAPTNIVPVPDQGENIQVTTGGAGHLPQSMAIGNNAVEVVVAPAENKIVCEVAKRIVIGWKCSQCTFVNEPTRPGCQMCSEPRPTDYLVPEDHKPSEAEQARIRKESEVEQEAAQQRSLERRENYERHVSVVDQSIVQSVEPVECMICFTDADPADTIVLRECLHRFCKDCIVGHIVNSEEATVSCPYADDNYNCELSITEREVRALLSEEQFQKYLARGLRQAEKASPNSFHCKTPDCQGWCVYEDQVNTFACPVCLKDNCLTCKAIHGDLNCKQYQDELQLKAATDEEAQKTKKLLDKMVKDGDAMNCPQCNIIIQKKVGCDWLRCPMCKVEICWVTKGPRWGPKGRGDASGGCHCRENGKKCHRDCNNCH